MSKKKGKSWSELSSGEKKAVVVGWAAIVIFAGWFFLPSKEAQPTANVATSEVSPAVVQGPVYTTGGPDALAAANKLMAGLDKAMLDSPAVVSQGDVQALGAHSRRFSDLAASAEAQFGATIGDPLGRCGIASGNARSWWQAQLAAQKNGAEPVPGAIKEFLQQYQENRQTCLEAAGIETHG
ncbi:hypothetical protein LOY46_11205 [Pseudomonas sichuanensis]|uniref:hypothetical protein n=1 Tax=Pseudomonas sichuanensis TaxID=2213015 RepID=UPI00215FF9E9|nr:hypothetical protein [Pseudomonas sichuanensis]UVK85211.1 hypothetical protein LOY46_11205 [Pseudomonas sichuanensis]